MSGIAPRYDFVFLHASPVLHEAQNMHFHLGKLDHKLEIEKVKGALKETGKNLVMRSSVATVETFSSIATLGCRALHFAGHGQGSALCLERSTGAVSHCVSGKELVELLSSRRGTDLIFLSACDSDSLAKELSRVVKHVVAVKGMLENAVAAGFAWQFYLGVFNGCTVQDAFDQACHYVQVMSPTIGRVVPRDQFLLISGAPGEPLSGLSDAHGEVVDATERSAPHNIEEPRLEFIGRKNELVSIVTNFLIERKNVVTVRGPVGIGKSELALHASHYMNERRFFARTIMVKMANLVPPSQRRLSAPSVATATSTAAADRQDRLFLLRKFSAAVGGDLSVNATFEELVVALKASGKVLFVLDGCEHFISPPAPAAPVPKPAHTGETAPLAAMGLVVGDTDIAPSTEIPANTGTNPNAWSQPFIVSPSSAPSTINSTAPGRKSPLFVLINDMLKQHKGVHILLTSTCPLTREHMTLANATEKVVDVERLSDYEMAQIIVKFSGISRGNMQHEAKEYHEEKDKRKTPQNGDPYRQYIFFVAEYPSVKVLSGNPKALVAFHPCLTGNNHLGNTRQVAQQILAKVLAGGDRDQEEDGDEDEFESLMPMPMPPSASASSTPADYAGALLGSRSNASLSGALTRLSLSPVAPSPPISEVSPAQADHDALRRAKEVAELSITDVSCLHLWAELTKNTIAPYAPHSSVLFVALVAQLKLAMHSYICENHFDRSRDMPGAPQQLPTASDCRDLNIDEMYLFCTGMQFLVDGAPRLNSTAAIQNADNSGYRYANVRITLTRFAEFVPWWTGLLHTLCKLHLEYYSVVTASTSQLPWSQTSVISGFVSHAEATARLMSVARPTAGLFLVRFSSKPGSLAISFTEYQGLDEERTLVVSHMLAVLKEDGVVYLVVEEDKETGARKLLRCGSFKDMVMGYKSFKVFYPSFIHKREVQWG